MPEYRWTFQSFFCCSLQAVTDAVPAKAAQPLVAVNDLYTMEFDAALPVE